MVLIGRKRLFTAIHFHAPPSLPPCMFHHHNRLYYIWPFQTLALRYKASRTVRVPATARFLSYQKTKKHLRIVNNKATGVSNYFKFVVSNKNNSNNNDHDHHHPRRHYNIPTKRNGLSWIMIKRERQQLLHRTRTTLTRTKTAGETLLIVLALGNEWRVKNKYRLIFCRIPLFAIRYGWGRQRQCREPPWLKQILCLFCLFFTNVQYIRKERKEPFATQPSLPPSAYVCRFPWRRKPSLTSTKWRWWPAGWLAQPFFVKVSEIDHRVPTATYEYRGRYREDERVSYAAAAFRRSRSS